MKTTKTNLISIVVAAGFALVIAGCATSGYDAGTKTAANIQDAANRIAAVPGLIDQTLGAMNDLIQNPQPDLRPQFKKFSSQLDSMISEAKDIGDARRSMDSKGKEFFAKWDEQIAQIHNEDIKARSQSRKEEVSQKLLAIKRSYSEAEIAFTPFVSDLKDVQKFLSVDLTTGGLAAIKSPAANAVKNAGPLKDCCVRLAADFKALGVAMSAVAPAPAK
jgi:hypothetical protein